MQGSGGRRAWAGSGSPGAPFGHPEGGPSGWVPTVPPPFVFLPPVPQASGPRLGRQQPSPEANGLANTFTPPATPSIPSSYRQSRRAGDRSLFAPVDRRVIVQAAGNSLRRPDSGRFRVRNEGTPTGHNTQTTLRTTACRIEHHGAASPHGISSVSANRTLRHTGGPSNERPANTVGRSRSGSGGYSTTGRTEDSSFDELAVAFNTMNFSDDQLAGTRMPSLPTVEDMERRMRSSESSFLGVSALPYTNARGLSPARGFQFVSALQRPGSSEAHHRSHSNEQRPPLSFVDERYLWSGDDARPRRSNGDLSYFLRSSRRSEGMNLLDDLFGERLGARLHDSVAANMLRSFLSPVTSPVALPWRGPWEVRVGVSLPAAHRAEHQRHPRRVTRGPNSSLVLIASASADPENFDVLERSIGRFIEEIERSFAFEDLDDLDIPLMLVVSGGDAGDGDEFVPHIWADASGPRVTLQQISEARSLRDSLGQHTFKWTFGEAKQVDGNSTTASHGMKPPAGTNRGMAQQTQRGLGSIDASTDAVADSSGGGAQSETHNGYDCCICLSAFETGDALLTLRCLHIFHERCIDRWIKTSHSVKCPLCSTKIAGSPSSEQFDE
ncbi:zinc finger (C3HC4 RING finger) protein, putative [Eimeria acervulina]|uniref:RING-type E3 ubiquitin transferase n=1 Tax=Eimeria acervulina TaxID=5801 RepID=U6GNP0_EIMAC|nr:zinc finger (C3HC4 RING finger) protein, putative [Eimeria acervulina]CDI81795.1 zinc finger (C3HC4 RING finger) protein, putative [Eimeria acervulina]